MSKRAKFVPVSPTLKALTPNQEKYIEAIENSVVTICVGPAGTGKTWVACGLAVKLLKEEKISKIIISRPLVLCGNEMGAFPGGVEDKVSPYYRPLMDAFEQFIPDVVERKRLIDKKIIEMIPLELMRGSSLKNAFVICDEAQNATLAQLHMFLTRFGKGCKVVLAGDVKQADTFQYGRENGLQEVINKLRPRCHRSIRIVELSREDVIRHPLISWIDQRLLGEIEFEPEPSPIKEWQSDTCPNCEREIWWDENESKHEVEQVICYHCRVVLDVFEDELVITDIKLNECLRTYEEKQ